MAIATARHAFARDAGEWKDRRSVGRWPLAIALAVVIVNVPVGWYYYFVVVY